MPIACGSTREDRCPPCADQARRLRIQQCREGWHLDTEPEHQPHPDPEPGADDEDQADEHTAGRRVRSTRRRQDAPELPRLPMEDRTIGRVFTAPDGKTYRPSMFLTLTLPSYGRVTGFLEHGPASTPTTWRRWSDAEKFARQVEVDKDRGLFIDPALARTTVAEVAARWLASNPDKRDGSWQRDEIVVHVLPELGAQPVGSLTPGDVQALVNTWATKHAPGTVRREYSVLRAILDYALVNDMIGRTPCRRIKLPEVVPVRRHIIDGDELGRLAAAMGGVERYGTMAYLGTVDGLRWGEVAGLHVGQFDFGAGTVRITQTVVRGRRGTIGLGEPKSDAGRRTLAVPVALVEMVGKHLAARGLTVDDRDALLFTAPDGGMLRYSNWLRRVWYPATVAAGLGKLVEDEATGRTRYVGLGFHDLRRANATGLVAEGVDIKTAQAMLGHSNVQLTVGLYAHAVVSLGAAAAESMAARFQLPGSPRDEPAMEGGENGDEQQADDDATP